MEQGDYSLLQEDMHQIYSNSVINQEIDVECELFILYT